jgi:hypothetical protein
MDLMLTADASQLTPSTLKNSTTLTGLLSTKNILFWMTDIGIAIHL